MVTLLLEHWKPVVGFEHSHEVSSVGNIRRLNAAKYLKPKPTKDGYRKVNLRTNGGCVTQCIHTVVAAAFIGKRPPNAEVNHIDLLKDNNRQSNLEYLLPAENMKHYWTSEASRHRRIDPEKVQVIQELWSTWGTANLASLLAMRYYTVRSIGRRTRRADGK